MSAVPSLGCSATITFGIRSLPGVPSLLFHSFPWVQHKKLELNTSLKDLVCPSPSTPTVQIKGTRLFRSLATSILRLLLLWPCLTSPSACVSALCCRQSSRDCSSCPASPQCSSSYVWTPWCRCNQPSVASKLPLEVHTKRRLWTQNLSKNLIVEAFLASQVPPGAAQISVGHK